jgi:uncharacterized protein
MYKVSKYNRYYEIEGEYYIYNLLSKALLQVEDVYTFKQLQSENLKSLETDTIQLFLTHRIIFNENVPENLHILRLYKTIKYGNKNARVIILPTLGCNFRCWYCYENHNNQHITTDKLKAISLFTESLLKDNHLNSFTLDWFGGEPFLFYKTIMQPLSKIVMDQCHSCGVPFKNMVTTNGALITHDMIPSLNEIQLKHYQITLDGGKEFHNKTRFSTNLKDSFGKIVDNVTMLVSAINDIDMTIRINCTSENIHSIHEISECFSTTLRPKIKISFQPIWQEVKSLESYSALMPNIAQCFVDAGYIVPSQITLPPTPNICYVDNLLQYCIAPHLDVFKCTARDFDPSSSNCVGHIDDMGHFISNDNILLYYSKAFFENSTCLECSVLPICKANCIQKFIEKNPLCCKKEELISGVDDIIIKRIKNLRNN